MSAAEGVLPIARVRGSRMAGSAYWAMLRRIVLVAGTIDACWIAFYAWLGSPLLSSLNIVSVTMYAAAYLLIGQRQNLAAVVLVWVEVIAHAAIGSLLIGWDSGFHYFLLIFIPALVVGSAKRYAVPLLGLLLAFYLGLDAACAALGPLSPLPENGVRIARWVNIVLIFGMFYTLASFYRSAVLKAETRLLEQATTDPLTGLANRSHFNHRAAVAVADHKEPLGVMLADIDHFKRVNDEHGHAAGDAVLVRVAQVLRANMRDVDVLARWGGEEFLAMLPGNNLDAAAAVAERARQAVEATPIIVGTATIRITMSFGVAQLGNEDDMQRAIARADQALYASKAAGRNRVRVDAAVNTPAEPAAAA